MDSYQNYEQEIDLKDLMFAVLRRWRPIILIAFSPFFWEALRQSEVWDR